MPKVPPADPRWILEEADSVRLQAEYPSLWTNPDKTCITCLFHTRQDKSRTFRWWDAERSEVVDWECDCRSQWMMNRYMLAHGIGKGYQRLGWLDASHVPAKAVDQTLEYLSQSEWYIERGVNVIFHSKNPGTGKTLMLMLLAKGLLAKGEDVYVVQMNKLVDMYSAGWRSNEERAYFEQRIMNCRKLHIDDLGKEKSNEDSALGMVGRLVDRVIRHRTAESMPTSITTNLTPDQIASGYSSYVMSLLTESCTFVEVAGVDWRPRAQARMREEILGRLCRPLVTA
jgi:DNA replication protein DnaC